MASGWSICAPAPKASARGRMPAAAASAVMAMGRKRRRPACTIRLLRRVSHGAKLLIRIQQQNSILATIPTTMINP